MSLSLATNGNLQAQSEPDVVVGIDPDVVQEFVEAYDANEIWNRRGFSSVPSSERVQARQRLEHAMRSLRDALA